MNVTHPKAITLLETIALEACELGAAARKLKRAINGDVDLGTNPFTLEKDVHGHMSAISKAYKELNSATRAATSSPRIIPFVPRDEDHQ